MALRRVGFFAELKHGDPDGPSLREARCAGAQPDEERIAGYLNGGAVLATTGRLVDDILDPTQRGVALLETRTDGEWLWPGDLGYYLLTYHISLPLDFLEHARSLNFVAPQIDDARLQDIVRQVRGN
jgi:hypothetical protein